MRHPRPRPILLAALLATATGCGSEGEQEYLTLEGGVTGMIHPTEEGRLSSHTDVPVVEVSFPPDDVSLPPELAPLSVFDDSSAIGLLEASDSSEADLVFGTLIDAEVAADGSVLLLDEDYSTIRVLSPTLEPIQRVGREGEGPGEFTGGRSLLRLAPDEIGVLENYRIEAFHKVAGEYQFSERLPIQSLHYTWDVCGTGDRLFSLGHQVEVDGARIGEDGMTGFAPAGADLLPEVLHELNRTGEPVHSFPAGYEATMLDNGNQWDVTIRLNRATVACGSGRVWVAYEALGEVHAFGEDGDLEWVARIGDFALPGLLFMWDPSGERVSRSGMVYGDLPARLEQRRESCGFAVDVAEKITQVSNRALAVQVTDYHREWLGDGCQIIPGPHRTYLLDPEDGHLLGGFRSDHQILGGGNGTAILYREDPFPQISVVKLEEG